MGVAKAEWMRQMALEYRVPNDKCLRTVCLNEAPAI
jgi:hypothetical protein